MEKQNQDTSCLKPKRYWMKEEMIMDVGEEEVEEDLEGEEFSKKIAPHVPTVEKMVIHLSIVGHVPSVEKIFHLVIQLIIVQIEMKETISRTISKIITNNNKDRTMRDHKIQIIEILTSKILAEVDLEIEAKQEEEAEEEQEQVESLVSIVEKRAISQENALIVGNNPKPLQM
jgi:hypothetical protein